MTYHFDYNRPFILESGEELPGFRLAYTLTGTLNSHRSNVAWIFHALTGNAHPREWWPGMFAPNNYFDANQLCVICVNMPGSCYGSTGPLSINPNTQKPFYHDFPLITIYDMVRMYDLLRQYLGITAIQIGIGGSMGGMQALEWAYRQPKLFKELVVIATNARHSAWGIAFNATQRLAIEGDATWKDDTELAGIQGMQTARAIAMLSYRNYDTYVQDQTDKDAAKLKDFKAASYQFYQGQKLALRFNAFSYYALTKTMDAHCLGRGSHELNKALANIKAKTLVVAIESDVLFTLQEQLLLSRLIPNASLAIIDSKFGHDGFLIEAKQIHELIQHHFSPAFIKSA